MPKQTNKVRPRNGGTKRRKKMSKPENGAALKHLRMRAGLNQDACAQILNMSTASSYARYENSPRYATELIPAEIVAGLAPSVVGKGTPPVTLEELTTISTAKALVPLIAKQESKTQNLSETDAAASAMGVELAMLQGEKITMISDDVAAVKLPETANVESDKIVSAFIVVRR